MNRKQAAHFLGFLAVAVLLLCLLGELLRDKATTLSALYSEPEQSVDVLIVGSSHVNCGYIPSMLWEENHLSACNVYSWSQPMWVSYHYILEALQSQSPKAIVLELYGMMYGHSYMIPEEIDRTSYANSFTIDPGWNRLELIATAGRCGIDLRDPFDFLALPNYHTRWRSISARDIFYNAHDQHDSLKGYNLLMESVPFREPGPFAVERAREPYEYCVEYLEKITALCEKRRIKLFFTLVPYVYSQEEAELCRWIEQYSADKGVPFLNYLGADGARIDFDYGEDLCDNGHCNYRGAQKITRDLCAYLREWLPTPDKADNPACALLEEDYERFRRVTKLNGIMAEPTLDRWLDAALADDQVRLLISDTGRNAEASRTVRGALGVQDDGALYCVLQERGVQRAAPEQTVRLELFGEDGAARYRAQDAGILLNDVQTPAPEGCALQIILYDNVLQRPIEAVWMMPDTDQTLYAKEFTSDILPLYRRK